MASLKPDRVSQKKLGRKRRVAGWTLLLLGLLVAGVWGSSCRWYVQRARKGWDATYTRGELFVIWTSEGDEHFGSIGWNSPSERGLRWKADFREYLGHDFAREARDCWVASYGTTGHARAWHIVLWPLPLLLWTPAALLLRSGILARRRANTGMCAKCGYSLAGLVADAKCPECGRQKTGE